jgi:hypothetical protein
MTKPVFLFGPHVTEVRIKRIVVKVPPIATYYQVADELNRGS